MEIKTKNKRQFSSSFDVFNIFSSILKMEQENDRMKEHFWVMGLSSRNKIIYIELVSLGTLNACIVHPREVFRLAVKKNVCSIIAVHNHPSGDCEPSDDDISVFHRLRKAGELLGIGLIDNVIIAKKYYSFQEKNLL